MLEESSQQLTKEHVNPAPEQDQQRQPKVPKRPLEIDPNDRESPDEFDAALREKHNAQVYCKSPNHHHCGILQDVVTKADLVAEYRIKDLLMFAGEEGTRQYQNQLGDIDKCSLCSCLFHACTGIEKRILPLPGGFALLRHVAISRGILTWHVAPLQQHTPISVPGIAPFFFMVSGTCECTPV